MNTLSTRLFPVILTAFALASCGNKKEEEAKKNAPPPPVSVAVYKVGEEPVVSFDTYPGTVVPLNEVELRAEVGGYVTGIFIKDGQRVTKGQRLYELDQTRYQADLRQAQAQLAVARSNYARAAKDAERYNRLAQQDAIARQRVDYAQTDVANAASQISAAQAAVTTVAQNLKRSVVVAPFAGTIGISQVKLGSLATQGSTLLNTISSDDPIAVDVAVGEQQIQRFQKLQRQPAAKADSVYTLVMAGKQEYSAPGKITTIDRAVDPQTGTVKVRVQFPNAQRLLLAGMNTTLRVRNDDTGRQLTIPYKAVTEQMGEFFVYVVGDSSKVAQRKVALGTRVDDKVVVREGLKANETIVSEGVQNLRQGAVVKVDDPNAPAQPADSGAPTAAK
ncbi:efflux RND transporter periplasmic adaptor subunit [Hymenobacter sp. BT683]|uniref:Efflux RND transporter periplasmic adaptor subunit n=1 Tax=Hymenobacter jeongseonensis TaxID=2791027 RepID=A0ABS0IEU7_9BACT|nr:efflux RND transporter periplasmic adaptor subunit [Hymenobacter jeongseonensis]MBF9236881.1 efflux RND transporter periplasmic adaptor subunit [Hymenobacter jeongseonensis]